MVKVFVITTITLASLAQNVTAQSRDDETAGEWILSNIIQMLGIGVLGMVVIWCFCSLWAGRQEKFNQAKRRKERQAQEQEELSIQTQLYDKQESQQRSILQILQDRLTEKRKTVGDDEDLDLPGFIHHRQDVERMQRDEVEDEFAKITQEQIEQLDEDSKTKIKNAQDIIA